MRRLTKYKLSIPRVLLLQVKVFSNVVFVLLLLVLVWTMEVYVSQGRLQINGTHLHEEMPHRPVFLVFFGGAFRNAAARIRATCKEAATGRKTTPKKKATAERPATNAFPVGRPDNSIMYHTLTINNTNLAYFFYR